MNYPITFKAAVLEEPKKPLVIKNVTFDGPLQHGQVLVKVQASGICGKQLEEIAETAGPDKFLPHMLGHEGAGIVLDVGPGVHKVVAGDYVVMHWMKGSGVNAETPLYTSEGQRINAGWITTFNEMAVVSENRITKITTALDPKYACLLGCAVSTGLGVALLECNIQPQDSVAVFGCGGVGLNAIQGAKIRNAKTIIAVDRNPASLMLAEELGATHVFDSYREDLLTQVCNITDHGANHVIICAANPLLITSAIECCAAPGVVHLVAVPPKGSYIVVNPLDIHRQKTLTGSCGGNINPDGDIPYFAFLAINKQINVEALVHYVVSIDDINKGIESLKSGMIGRCVVDFR